MLVSRYVSQQKSQLLDSLENQVSFSQLVAVVVAEKGIGKSFLLNELHTRLEDKVLIARIDASLAMSDDQLEKSISLQLGLSWRNSDVNLENRIKNDLTQKVLITIDDAHLLSIECLDFILRLNQNQLAFNESVIFVLLVGELSLPSIISQTKTFEEHQDMCVVFQIEPIEQSETKYVMESFQQYNGSNKEILYDTKKLDYFWQLSRGNPAEINYHLSRWLDEKSPSLVVEIEETKGNSYLKSIGYFLIASVLVAMLIFQQEINQWISPNKTSPTLDDSISSKAQPVDSLTTEKESLAKTKLKSQTEDHSKVEKPEIEPIKESLPIVVKEEESSNKVAKNTFPKAKAVEQSVSEPAKVLLTLDEKNLLVISPDYYAIQWVVVSHLKAAEDYKSKHPSSNKVKIYRRYKNNKTLFVVISDFVANRQLAESAAKSYRLQGIKEKPWVKSMALVRDEINRFKQIKSQSNL